MGSVLCCGKKKQPTAQTYGYDTVQTTQTTQNNTLYGLPPPIQPLPPIVSMPPRMSMSVIPKEDPTPNVPSYNLSVDLHKKVPFAGQNRFISY